MARNYFNNTLVSSNKLMKVEAVALLFHMMSFPFFSGPLQSQEGPHLPQEPTQMCQVTLRVKEEYIQKC